MAEVKSSVVNNEQMVKSEAFPNLKVSEPFQKDFDQVLTQVKDYSAANPADAGVQKFIEKLAKLENYSIHDGSTGKDCSGVHNGKGTTGEINVPFQLAPDQGGTGKYHGADGNLHDMTFARAVVHELAHATQMDREVSSLTAGVVDKLQMAESAERQKFLGARGGLTSVEMSNYPRFPSGIAHEAGAVAVENSIARSVFHDHNPRLNVGDRGGKFSIDSLKEWESNGYPIHGECKNGTALKRDREEPHAASGQVNVAGLGAVEQSGSPAALPDSRNTQMAKAYVQDPVDKALEKFPELAGMYAAKGAMQKEVAGLTEENRASAMAFFEAHAIRNLEEGKIPPIQINQQATHEVTVQREPQLSA